MIESLRTTQIAFFRFAMPSGFLGAETRYKKYSCKSPCKGKSYETICENIVSRYQTLVSSLPRGNVFLHRRPKTELITGQPWKGGAPVKSSTPRRLVWDSNMAAVSLFWDTNVAAVMSCENTPYSQKLFLCWEPWFMSWTLPQNEIVVKCNLL